MKKPRGPHPRLIVLDEALVPTADTLQGSCWSIWEGCVCGQAKTHFGPHSCDDPNCNTTWTTEQSDEWLDAEQEAHRTGGSVTDRHRKET